MFHWFSTPSKYATLHVLGTPIRHLGQHPNIVQLIDVYDNEGGATRFQHSLPGTFGGMGKWNSLESSYTYTVYNIYIERCRPHCIVELIMNPMQLQYESDMYLIGILILIKPASEIESDMILWIQPESINSIQYGAHINRYFIEAVQMDPSHLVLQKNSSKRKNSQRLCSWT